MTRPTEVLAAIRSMADAMEEAAVNGTSYIDNLSVEDYNALAALANDAEAIARLITETIGAATYFDELGDDEV